MSNNNAALSLQAQIDALKAENAKLKAGQATKAQGQLSFKVSEKGAVSVYGLTVRFPVTLYRSQWQRLVQALPELEAFMLAHKDELDASERKHEAEKTAAKAGAKTGAKTTSTGVVLRKAQEPRGNAPSPVKVMTQAETQAAFAEFMAKMGAK